jgi:hypothetical protein
MKAQILAFGIAIALFTGLALVGAAAAVDSVYNEGKAYEFVTGDMGSGNCDGSGHHGIGNGLDGNCTGNCSIDGNKTCDGSHNGDNPHGSPGTASGSCDGGCGGNDRGGMGRQW